MKANGVENPVAVKVAYMSKMVANPPLRHEACALLALQGELFELFFLSPRNDDSIGLARSRKHT